jgi:Ca2+/Na+ antiporter
MSHDAAKGREILRLLLAFLGWVFTRPLMYVLVGLALLAPVVQFEYKAYHDVVRKQHRNVQTPSATQTQKAIVPAPQTEVDASADEGGKDSIGAIWRWRTSIRQFWRGYNIYQMPDQKWVSLSHDWNGHKTGEHIEVSQARAGKLIGEGLAEEIKNDRSHGPLPSGGGLHPNSLFTVIFLTPLALLPVGVMTVVMNLLKLGIIVASILMAASICNHGGKKMPDWVVLLGVVWSLIFIIADIQHGNTNTFTMGALVGSLWLYRKGRDGWAGAGLALAICLKMMPAIFLLYWLYQRGWKVLASTVMWLVVMLVVLPASAMAVREMVDPATADAETQRRGDAENGPVAAAGWDLHVARAKDGLVHYRELTETWYNNLISPGLVKAAWYPIHINQSMPGVLSRLLLGGKPGGDIFWGPDDYPNYADHLAAPGHQAGWIAVASLDETTVKTITRICQVVVVGLMAWGIGWRKLSRDDGRRGLHYGMVIAAMLMLNQRTWVEHAGAMLVAMMTVFYTISFGRVGKWNRAVTLAMAMLAGPLLWFSGTEAFRAVAFLAKPHASMKTVADTGKTWSDWAQAYGTSFACFVLVFIACVILAKALKNQPQPYADTRQKLGQ